MANLRENFEQYHVENPGIYALYSHFAKEAKESGKKVLSISLITERIRWEQTIKTKSPDGFKLSNNHRAFYARKLDAEPEFTGMFRLREQRSVF